MTKFILAGLVIGGIFLAWKTFSRSAYESAPYTVVEKDGVFEIRDYPELVVATTNRSSATESNGSFRRLFRFISGGNQAEKKIAMTTPVFMGSSQSTSRQMSFVLPAKYELEQIPAPSNDAVKIGQRPAGRFAVIRFAGRLNEKGAIEQEQVLRQWVNDRGLSPSENVERAGYDSPFTPGPFRRNEVLIELK